MSASSEFESRRQLLVLDIARQRGELGRCYRNLAKPLNYVEKGMGWLGFLRRNQWLFIAGPSVLSMGSMLLGMTGLFGRKKLKAAPVQAIEKEAKAVPPRSKVAQAVQVARTGTGYAMELYRLYQRIRPYL